MAKLNGISTTINDQSKLAVKRACECEFLSGVGCAEGMGCARKWAIWVPLSTGAGSWRPEVS